MEIKINRNVVNTYKAISNAKPSEKKSGAAKPNVDTIEFDVGRSMSAAKMNIMERINAEANLAKIEQLQKQYAGDNCPVASFNAAGAVLGD